MDAKTFYEQIAPKLDPGGFKLYFTAKRMTGFDLYGQFPYEDARGMFEMMNGHQLMRYLLADQFHAVRWEIVPGTCYERAVLLPPRPHHAGISGIRAEAVHSGPARLPSESSETT